MSGWSGGIAEWIDGDTAYLSVVFSWNLPKAFQRAVWLKALGHYVIAGGPAVVNNPRFLSSVAEIGLSYPGALERHNPEATYTTRGCVRDCKFCIVPKIEPEYIELDNWPVRPIVCDNNLLASTDRHFESVIRKLKHVPCVDFNQGLDARLMTLDKARMIASLDMKVVRLAWDLTGIEKQWRAAFEMLRAAGISARKIQSYVLIGFNDTPEDALYRLETIKGLGARPNPQRYQPLTALKRNNYVAPGWTERQLRDYMRYWSRLRWLEHIPFADYSG